MQTSNDDPVLRSSRREAFVALAIWLAAMSYTVGTCWWRGYGRDWETVTFVLGFPDWVFWGIICPWLACVALSWWFAYCFMSDESLGEESATDTSEGSRDV
ncbi:MAG: DUF997 family protein, partial [Planctomycetota bacterium]